MSKHLKALSLGSMALAATGGIIWGIWHIHEAHSVSTDDARVESTMVTVGSKLAERVVQVNVREGDIVRRGQIIAVLDDRTIRARKLAAQSKVHLMQARHDEMMSGFRTHEIEAQRAKTAQAEATREHARRDYERIEALFHDHAGISQADRDAVRAAWLAAQSALKAEQENLALKTEGYREEEKRSALAQLEEARAVLSELNVLSEECVIKAPVDGIVAQKLVTAGELVSAGQKLFSLADRNDTWLNVRVEETKIGRIQPGQDVSFTVDGYPGQEFHGQVYEIGATTCSTFSLISTENVSGYFTKVMQRIPIKVSLPPNTETVIFRPGMQGTVHIDS